MDTSLIIMVLAGFGSALFIFLKVRKSFKEGCSSCCKGGCSACGKSCAMRDRTKTG